LKESKIENSLYAEQFAKNYKINAHLALNEQEPDKRETSSWKGFLRQVELMGNKDSVFKILNKKETRDQTLTCARLKSFRYSEVFESLRNAIKFYERETGKELKIYLLTLGPRL